MWADSEPEYPVGDVVDAKYAKMFSDSGGPQLPYSLEMQ